MIVLLSGGTGGARLARGLSAQPGSERLAIIANTGDDLYRFGLRICPDIDSILYLLAGKLNPQTGWGLEDDTFQCLQGLGELGADIWFQIGDRDLALHLVRHELLQRGLSLSAAIAQLADLLGITTQILPMSDGYLPTYLETNQGRLHMQEYFVREQCRPQIEQIVPLEGTAEKISPLVRTALQTAELVILGPSNPFISIGPILRTPGFMQELRDSAPRISIVSPIIGGRALKGPTARMLHQLGYPVNVMGIAQVYAGVIGHIIIDRVDHDFLPQLEALGLDVSITDIVMSTPEAEKRLAAELLETR